MSKLLLLNINPANDKQEITVLTPTKLPAMIFALKFLIGVRLRKMSLACLINIQRPLHLSIEDKKKQGDNHIFKQKRDGKGKINEES